MKNLFYSTLLLLLYLVPSYSIETERLILQAWTEENIWNCYHMMQDPEVNDPICFHHLDVYENIQAMALKANANIEKNGYGYFACIKKDSNEFIGLVGLNYVDLPSPPFPCYTVSYILARDHWGNGYAQEAASALLRMAFEKLEISEVFACTTLANLKSQNVMKRLGMKYAFTFDFPGMEETEPYCQHVMYRLTR